MPNEPDNVPPQTNQQPVDSLAWTATQAFDFANRLVSQTLARDLVAELSALNREHPVYTHLVISQALAAMVRCFVIQHAAETGIASTDQAALAFLQQFINSEIVEPEMRFHDRRRKLGIAGPPG